MLKLAICKGSLEEGTFDLFNGASIPMRRKSQRNYAVSFKDPRLSEVMLLGPKEVAVYLDQGEFDIGITGQDWIGEMGVFLVTVANLQFSRAGWNVIKMVLATNAENPIERVEDIPDGARVTGEYPNIIRKYFDSLGKSNMQVIVSDRATEAKVPRLAQYLVDITETGTTLKQNGMKILATIMKSSTVLVASQEAWNDPGKRREIEEIAELLLSVIRAREKSLLKLNVEKRNLRNILRTLPSITSPTVSPLYRRGWVAVETVVSKNDLGVVIPILKRCGAEGILETDIRKLMP